MKEDWETTGEVLSYRLVELHAVRGGGPGLGNDTCVPT